MGERLITLTCYKCKIEFGVPESFYRTARQVAEDMNFYCPAGHPQHFATGESDLDKMRRERDRAIQNAAYEADMRRRQAARADAAERSAAAYKGAATRLKNRAKAGLCPCCNRRFRNLRRHMAKQHPDHELDNVVELGQMGTQT